MNALLPQLVNWLQEYGYLPLWFAIFIAAVGVPLPISLVMLAAGAFSELGDFNVFLLALVAISASVCGDHLGYGIGRWWGTRLLDWLERKPRRFISPRLVAQARTYFARRGGWAIFLSRFLVSGFGGVINFLSGADPYPYRRFLLADVTGEAVGATIPLSLGYIFGASWEAVGAVLGDASLFFLAALIVLVLSMYLVRMLRHARNEATLPQPTLQGEQAVAELKAPAETTGPLPHSAV